MEKEIDKNDADQAYNVALMMYQSTLQNMWNLFNVMMVVNAAIIYSWFGKMNDIMGLVLVCLGLVVWINWINFFKRQRYELQYYDKWACHIEDLTKTSYPIMRNRSQNCKSNSGIQFVASQAIYEKTGKRKSYALIMIYTFLVFYLLTMCYEIAQLVLKLI